MNDPPPNAWSIKIVKAYGRETRYTVYFGEWIQEKSNGSEERNSGAGRGKSRAILN